MAGLDLMLLGIGPDAHICSLFPGDDALGERERPAVGVETPGMAPIVSRITLTLPVVNSVAADRLPGHGRGQGRRRLAGFSGRPTRWRRARWSRESRWRCSTRPRPPACEPVGPGRRGRRQPLPADRRYGFLSDCETCALVAPNANVEWLCLPRFDSPSVFGAMLDRDAGSFRLGPADSRCRPRGAICPAPRCSRRAGARAAAGSSCATCC